MTTTETGLQQFWCIWEMYPAVERLSSQVCIAYDSTCRVCILILQNGGKSKTLRATSNKNFDVGEFRVGNICETKGRSSRGVEQHGWIWNLWPTFHPQSQHCFERAQIYHPKMVSHDDQFAAQQKLTRTLQTKFALKEQLTRKHHLHGPLRGENLLLVFIPAGITTRISMPWVDVSTSLAFRPATRSHHVFPATSTKAEVVAGTTSGTMNTLFNTTTSNMPSTERNNIFPQVWLFWIKCLCWETIVKRTMQASFTLDYTTNDSPGDASFMGFLGSERAPWARWLD